MHLIASTMLSSSSQLIFRIFFKYNSLEKIGGGAWKQWWEGGAQEVRIFY